jgi:hypothetical protein
MPDREGLSPNRTIRDGGHQVSTGMEVAKDECMSGKEVLSLVRRFESLHLPLSTPGRPM